MGKLFHLPNSSPEAQLIRRCKRGDARAQRELYQRYAGAMMALCQRYLARSEEAEEVLSNGFVKVFQRLHQFQHKATLGAWIKTIMIREALNYIRYRKNHFQEWGEEHHLPSHCPGEETIDAEHLLSYIAGLPTGYRTVFNLYALEGYSHREIAKLLDISESTSKSQLRKARQQLQKMLQKTPDHHSAPPIPSHVTEH